MNGFYVHHGSRKCTTEDNIDVVSGESMGGYPVTLSIANQSEICPNLTSYFCAIEMLPNLGHEPIFNLFIT